MDRSIRARFVVVVMAALLSACGTTGPSKTAAPAEPERPRADIVKERAEARWALLIKRDFAAAYDYLSEGTRSLQTREAYAAAMGPRPVTWSAASVREIECPPAESFCKVLLDISFSAESNLRGVGQIPASSVVEERWILSGGEWGLVQQ